MLDGLAQVRAEGGDRTGAIHTWQEALRRFPEAARDQQMTETMRATFRDALIEGGRIRSIPCAPSPCIATFPS